MIMQKRKVGGWTAGLLLVATGMVIVLEALGIPCIRLYVQAWPVFLILLGIEYIWRGRQNPAEGMRFAWGLLVGSLSLSVLAMVLFTGWGLLKTMQHSDFSWSKLIELDFDEFRLSDAEPYVQLHSLPLSNDAERLEIENANGNITIISSAQSEILVRAESRFPLLGQQQAAREAEDVEIQLSERQGVIQLSTKSKRYGFGLIRLTPSVDLVIEVPADHPLALESEQVNGFMQISGSGIHDKIEVSTANGAIRIEQVDTTELVLSSTNGAIEVQQASGDITAHTVNGKITLSGSYDEVDARSTNGAIRISSLTVRDDWEVETTNGSIHLTLPRDSSFSIDGQVTTGKIEAPEPLVPDGKKLKGQIGRGEHDIEASTVNGSLNITLE